MNFCKLGIGLNRESGERTVGKRDINKTRILAFEFSKACSFQTQRY